MGKHTLKNRAMQESIRSISKVLEEFGGKLIIVGGVATQIYTPSPNLYRPTNDIDTFSTEPITNDIFFETYGPAIVEMLRRGGFRSNIGRSRYGYEARCETEPPFFIHINKFSQSYLKRNHKWKQREIDNAQMMEVPYVKGNPVYVHRLEDLMANKSRRLSKFAEEDALDTESKKVWEKYQEQKLDALSSKDLPKMLEKVEEVRAGMQDIGYYNFKDNIQRIRTYMALKDTYDVCVLARTVSEGKRDIDMAYLTHAMKSIPPIK